MKAVEYHWKNYGFGFSYPWDGGSVPVEGRSRLVKEGFSIAVRYDNGELCTFRRKTKGQNNER